MSIPPYKEGDVFLLFHKLPFDFHSKKLPLDIFPNLCLDRTPKELLDPTAHHSVDDSKALTEHQALAGFVLPGYGLEPKTNCCLRYYYAGINEYRDFEPKELFFISVTALRLRKPIGIEIAGQFEVGKKDYLIEKPQLFQITSTWNPNGDLRYSGEDISVVSCIAKDLLQIPERERKYKRITSAIIYFSQVTCGFSKSLQLCYLGLWFALEALFVPERKGSKADKLARRIPRFLSNFEFTENMSAWIKKEYKERNKLAHGIQDIMPLTGIRDSRAEAFGRLHEITRLCILGFLSLDQSKHVSLSQNELDALEPASGEYLEGQRMFFS